MPNAVGLTKAIKRAAVEAVLAAKPVEICFGKVNNLSPLKILTEQKLLLGEAQLVLLRRVTEFPVEVTVDWDTKNESGGSGEAAFALHKHAIAGKKKILVHQGLAVGDRVLLLRQQGGQKYIVVDRIQ